MTEGAAFLKSPENQVKILDISALVADFILFLFPSLMNALAWLSNCACSFSPVNASFKSGGQPFEAQLTAK